MLGTNDFQSMHPHTAWHAAQGIRALVEAIRQAPIEPGMAVPPLMLVAPPPILIPAGPIAPKFVGGDQKCGGIAEHYETVARELSCSFLNAADIISSSKVDGVHLDRDQHHLLGKALALRVLPLITG